MRMTNTIVGLIAAFLLCFTTGCMRVGAEGLSVRPLAAAADLAETQTQLVEEREQRVEADTNLGNHLASETKRVREDLSAAIQTAVAEANPAQALADLATKQDATNKRLDAAAAEASTISDAQLEQIKDFIATQRTNQGGDNTLLTIILSALGIGTVGAGTVAVKAGGRAKAAEAKVNSAGPVAS